MKKFLRILDLIIVVAIIVSIIWCVKTSKFESQNEIPENNIGLENETKNEVNNKVNNEIKNNNIETNETENKFSSNETSTEKNNFVSYNGKLKLNGTKIVNEKGENIQLRGVSSHGIQWYANFCNENSIKYLKENFGANVFRIAMYTEENGYISNKNLKNEVKRIVEIAKKEDMYVIIDWHILSDNNPNNHINESIRFFDEISKEYANTPNVIYEICNEPNGNVSWSNDIKPYAEKVISTIRNNSKDSLIIVGTPFWCQNVEDAANDPITDYNNILYSCHFYAGTHKEDLRNKVKNALNKGLPIIVSECGVSSADGNGGVFKEEADKWFEFLNENDISWVVWSLSDKNETSALLKPGTNPQNINDDSLSESGKYIESVMKQR